MLFKGKRLPDSLESKCPSAEEVLEILRQRDLLPGIWFLLSRVGCDNAVLRLQTQKVNILSPKEMEQVGQALQRVRQGSHWSRPCQEWREIA